MNHLQHETSPYLLQHAHNPVDWFAWKPEAFARAKAEDKPILVSIGYSTCHWCHVMERESFENEAVAELMNAHFVCIKVDREERPDVDHIYMDACQILTGGGGWPLNCFLTPEGKPFYAGTYFPPRPAHGRPSWSELLEHMANVWRTRREVAEEQAEKLLGHIRGGDDVFLKNRPVVGPLAAAAPELAGRETLDNLFHKIRAQFDRADGGFGHAPKFPGTMSLQFLLNYHHFTGNAEAREHALFSLDRMIFGGIYDQLGGGFARYATDRAWLVPHFEKMLYDNALLVGVLAEAFKLTKNDLYAETIAETLGYVQREMTHPEGGFYSAQDADSEGVEGKFFVWEKSQIEFWLEDEAPLFCQFYGVSEAGNWEEANILWREESFENFAQKRGLPLGALKARLATCRKMLFRERSKRIWPGLDDKVLLGWNALMCSAHCAAFGALGKAEYLAAAERNMAFCLEKFADASGGLLHTWKAGQAQYLAFLEDYAYLIAALLDLFEATFKREYLERAAALTELVFQKFHDSATGLFFFTEKNQMDILVRRKDLYDNAMPSGNSTMCQNLQRLGLLLDRADWRETAGRMLDALRGTVENFPLSFSRWAAALAWEVQPPLEIAVVGAGAEEVAAEIRARFLPNAVLVASSAETDWLPLLAGKAGGEVAQIYVCQNFACQRPVGTLAEFDSIVFPR